jgi:hypothetical protein
MGDQAHEFRIANVGCKLVLLLQPYIVVPGVEEGESSYLKYV